MSSDASLVSTEQDTDLFLMHVTRHCLDRGILTQTRVNEIFRDLTGLASRLMDRLILGSTSGRPREEAITAALRVASVGLESDSAGDLSRAGTILADESVSRVVHTGNAIAERFRKQVEHVRDLMTLRSGLPTALAVIDEIDLTNVVERMFLDDLVGARMALDEPAPRLTAFVTPRAISSMGDYKRATVMLDWFVVRRRTFDAFPWDRLFAQHQTTDEIGDTARLIVCRLLVSIAERGADVRFDATADDVRSFRRRADQAEVCEILREWISSFAIDVAGSDAGPITDYLASCLGSMPSALPLLEED